MKNMQRFGGFAALYMAIANLIGFVIFLVILDYLNISNPTEKVALNVDKQQIVFSTNLLMYVFFGLALIVFVLALYDRLKTHAQGLMQVATAVGFLWAGSLIASGMVANAGLTTIVPLFAKDPAQAALTWQGIETVTNGLGNANGEILGGTLTLLISLVGLRTKNLPKALNILGLVVGIVGIVTILPALNSIVGVFGLGQVIWFAWLGIVLLRSDKRMAVEQTKN
jgi:hypothetical protein